MNERLERKLDLNGQKWNPQFIYSVDFWSVIQSHWLIVTLLAVTEEIFLINLSIISFKKIENVLSVRFWVATSLDYIIYDSYVKHRRVFRPFFLLINIFIASLCCTHTHILAIKGPIDFSSISMSYFFFSSLNCQVFGIVN